MSGPQKFNLPIGSVELAKGLAAENGVALGLGCSSVMKTTSGCASQKAVRNSEGVGEVDVRGLNWPTCYSRGTILDLHVWLPG